MYARTVQRSTYVLRTAQSSRLEMSLDAGTMYCTTVQLDMCTVCMRGIGACLAGLTRPEEGKRGREGEG